MCRTTITHRVLALSLMQFLVLVDDLLPGIHSGLKKNTMRNGKRDIVLGPLEFRAASGNGATVSVNVSEVKFSKAADVSEEDCHANGYQDHADMLVSMLRFYPEFGPDSNVTVVAWDKVL
jgi:hypothetical protein